MQTELSRKNGVYIIERFYSCFIAVTVAIILYARFATGRQSVYANKPNLERITVQDCVCVAALTCRGD